MKRDFFFVGLLGQRLSLLCVRSGFLGVTFLCALESLGRNQSMKYFIIKATEINK